MLCFAEDDFTEGLQTDHRQALWKAELSDGTVVTMDDGRPGVAERSAWVRLGEHCRARGLSVRKVWLKFRSNVARDILPEGADGYYFCKSALGFLTGSRQTFDFFLLGALHKGKLVVQRWQVPELTLIEVEERDANYQGPCLIRSHNAAGQATRDLAPPER